jgi:hypothetical protein
MAPEDRERWIKIKISRDAILGSHLQFLLAGVTTNINSAGAVCDQKILVFVLQMEESKQSTWMG